MKQPKTVAQKEKWKEKGEYRREKGYNRAGENRLYDRKGSLGEGMEPQK